jgi:hypothetical protein
LRTSRERLHGSGSDTARREDSPGVEGTRRAGVGPRRVALPRAACVRALETLSCLLGSSGGLDWKRTVRSSRLAACGV